MTPQEIMEFFDKEIDTKNFARCIREYNYTVMIDMMNRTAENEILNIAPIADGVHWTNKLAEVIDPYFDK